MAKRKKQGILIQDDNFSMTSMIDIVFLLLIYFMYLPIQSESDLSISLPIPQPPTSPAMLPMEHKVRIMPNGTVLLNDSIIETGGQHDTNFAALTSALTRLKRSANSGGLQMVVTIIPDGDSLHQSAMSVLDACKSAGVNQVSFSDAT